MNSNQYMKRIADITLQEKLSGMGAVLIEGPKWCGKTTTAEQHSNSVIYMDNPKSRKANIQTADIDPNLLLEGSTPRLIDEWQLAPQLWDAVRYTVDHRPGDGQFILTGSAVPSLDEEDKEQMHTGTGRIARIRMRTMSLWESGDSSGKISLKALFEGIKQSASHDVDIQTVAYLTCRGGWPKSVIQSQNISLERATDYYEAIINSDIERTDKSLKNPDRAALLMRSYSRLLGSQAPLTAICADMASSQGSAPDVRTVQSYINALKLIFVIEDMPAWNPNLRSKTAIRTSDTRYFVDPSIAVASLGIGPEDLMSDLKTFGFLFENLCVRDLRIYSEPLKGKVYHFRDSKGLECDAVIHLRNGNYGLVEIKLGGDKLIEEGASNLLKLRERINSDYMKTPAFMMVLTATGKFAFQRKDGVYVVPVTCLKD